MNKSPEFIVTLTSSVSERSLDLSRITQPPGSSLIIPVSILRIVGAISTKDKLHRGLVATPFGDVVLLGQDEVECETHETLLDIAEATIKIETFLEDNEGIYCRIPRDNLHLFPRDFVAQMPPVIRSVVESEMLPGLPMTGQYI